MWAWYRLWAADTACVCAHHVGFCPQRLQNIRRVVWEGRPLCWWLTAFRRGLMWWGHPAVIRFTEDTDNVLMRTLEEQILSKKTALLTTSCLCTKTLNFVTPPPPPAQRLGQWKRGVVVCELCGISGCLKETYQFKSVFLLFKAPSAFLSIDTALCLQHRSTASSLCQTSGPSKKSSENKAIFCCQWTSACLLISKNEV